MSGKAKKDTDYLFLSSMLRARENRLLTQDQLARLIDSPSLDDALGVLPDCGYERLSPVSSEALELSLSSRREELFGELAALAPEPAIVDLFRLRYDYHNAKVLVKSGADAPDDMLSGAGRVPRERFREYVAQGEFSSLPPVLSKAVADAGEILSRTGDAQLSDIVLDRAWFDELSEYAKRTKSAFLMGYVQLLADSANLRAAVRAMRMGKTTDFLRRVLVDGGTVKPDDILAAALEEKAFPDVFGGRLSAAAVCGGNAVSGGSLAELDAACDKAVAEYLASAGMVSFGEQPLISYICAVESEIRTLRRVVGGRLAGLSAESIRERLWQ